jgi:hypothetical protein
VTIVYDPRQLEAKTEEIPIDDQRLKSVWGDRLYRILLKADNPPTESTWDLSIAEQGRS